MPNLHWKKLIPLQLTAPIEHIQGLFDAAAASHWALTTKFCFMGLHPEIDHSYSAEWAAYMAMFSLLLTERRARRAHTSPGTTERSAHVIGWGI
jgi:hypothetical protein